MTKYLYIYIIIYTNAYENLTRVLHCLRIQAIFQVHSISFLDVKIVRQINSELKFKVHRKPTSNYRYLDFISCNPINQKAKTKKALQRRAYMHYLYR